MAQIRIQAIIDKNVAMADAATIGKTLGDAITAGATQAGAAVTSLQTTIGKLAEFKVADPFQVWSSSAAKLTTQLERIVGLMDKVGGAGAFRSMSASDRSGSTKTMSAAEVERAIDGLNLARLQSTYGASGLQRQTEQYRGVQEGQNTTATVNRNSDGDATRLTILQKPLTELSAAQQAASKSSDATTESTGRMAAAMATAEAGVSKLGRAWRSTVSTMVEFAATAYIVRAAATSIGDAFVAPYKAILNATEDSRRFELAIQSFVGGAANARAVDGGIATGLNSTPLSLADNRQMVEALTRVAPIAEQLANATPQQIGAITGQYAQTISGLQALNPQTSTQQIVNAVETSLLGQGRGLRSIVRIDPDQLAELVGKNSSTAFKGNPELLMSALSQYSNLFSPSGSAEQLNNMPSVQVQHIKDEFQLALQTIGDSGLFDEVVGKIRTAADSLLAYVGSEDYQARARSIGQSLGVIFDNVSRSALTLLQQASGSAKPADTLNGVAGQVDEAFKLIGAASGALPDLASGAGQAIHRLGVELAWLAEKLNLTVESAAESAARIEHITSPTTWFGGKGAQVDELSQRNIAIANAVNSVTGSQMARTNQTTFGAAWAASPDDGFGILSGIRGAGVNDNPFTDLSSSNPYYAPFLKSVQTDISSRGLQLERDGTGAKSQFLSPETVRQIVRDEAAKYGVMLSGQTTTPTATPVQSTPAAATRGTTGALPDDVISKTDLLQRRAIGSELGVLSGDATEGSGGRAGGAKYSDADVIALLQKMANNGVFSPMTADDKTGFSQVNASMAARIGAASNPDAIAALQAEAEKQQRLEGVIAGAPDHIDAALAVGGFNRAAATRDPMLRASAYNQAVAGTTAPAAYAANLQGVPDSEQRFGLLNVPQGQRIDDLDASVKANLDYVKTTGGNGLASQGFDLQRQIDIYTSAVTQTKLLADATDKGSQAFVEATAKGADYGVTLQKLQSQQVANAAQQIEHNGGLITSGMSPDQVARMASTPVQSSLLGGQGRDDQQLALYTSALSQAKSDMASAKATIDGTTQATAAQTQAFNTASNAVADYSQKIAELQTKNGGLVASFTQVGNSIQNNLSSTIGQSLTDIETKTGSVSAAFRSMSLSILNELNQTFAKQIVGSIFGTPNGKSGAGNGLGGLLGGFVGNLINPQGNDTNGIHGVETPRPVVPLPTDTSLAARFGPYGMAAIHLGFAAAGAVAGGMTGGAGGAGDFSSSTPDVSQGGMYSYSPYTGSGDFNTNYANQSDFETPLQYHALGGVFDRGAHVGIVGEAGAELVAPLDSHGFAPLSADASGLHVMLPGGRKVPAAMHAMGGVFGDAFVGAGAAMPQYGPNAGQGTTREMHHYIIVESAESAFMRGFNSKKDMLVNVMAAQLGKAGSPMRKALNRPGG